MEKVIIEGYGGVEALQHITTISENPKNGEVMVRLYASGVNFIDIYQRTGLYPLPKLPHGLGVEGVGIIEECGKDAGEWKKGDRVVYTGTAPGSYATHQCVPTSKLIRVPQQIEFERLAACFLRGLTVEYLLERCYPVQRGQTVLFHAIAGGVGQIACQWLKHKGCKVIATAGGKEKCAIGKKLGADHVIDYTQVAFENVVKELTHGNGVPVVYDAVGAATFEASLKCLQPRGMLVSFGNASGAVENVNLGILARHGGLYVTRPMLAHYTRTRAEYEAASKRLFEMLLNGLEIKYSKAKLSEVGDVHRKMEARQTQGPTILVTHT